jgi:hypothetical protein
MTMLIRVRDVTFCRLAEACSARLGCQMRCAPAAFDGDMPAVPQTGQQRLARYPLHTLETKE